MSATHDRFGPAERNWRSTRSSATLTPGTRIVVAPRRLVTRPEMPGLCHQPRHALLGDPDPVSLDQLGVDARRPIDATRLGVDLLDPLDQERVGQRPVRRRPS